jgi:hypothetical protein
MKNNFVDPIDHAPTVPRRLMLVFMLTTLLVPVSLINKLLFVFLLLWTLILIAQIRKPHFRLSLPAFSVITIFLYGFLISMLGNSDSALAAQFFLATLILLLIHFVDYYRINMDLAAELCGKVMIGATIFYSILVLNRDVSGFSEIFEWFNQISASSAGEREFIEGGVMTLALGTAPFLFVPWCIVTIRLIRFQRVIDLFWLLLYGLMIGLSGARGVMVVAIAFFIGASIWLAPSRIRFLIIIGIAILLLISIPFLLSETSIFSSEESSNFVKIGHFNSYVDDLSVSGVLFGDGLGSYYFSSGRDRWMAHTELTPIDMARYLGIPLALTFYALLIFPTSRFSCYRGDNVLFSFGFFLFLVLSMTNPTLVNSYGMLVIVWYWSKIRTPAIGHPTNLIRQTKINSTPIVIGAKA